jgi:hypothetical protein
MAANKAIRLGPVAMSNTVADIFNPPTLTGGVNPPALSTASYYIIRKIRITNKTAGAVTANLYIGATGASAAGTEIMVGKSVPANDSIEVFGLLRLGTADFLTGSASALTSLVIEAEGEIGVV